MTSINKVIQEPAFVLHTRSFKETSLIVDLFTKNLGKISVVAKGAKRAKNKLRSVLTPNSLFSVSYSGRGELKNLIDCEVIEHFSIPAKLTLSCIVYINELLTKTLEKEDPHSEIFRQYNSVCSILVNQDDQFIVQSSLRSFELVLLQELGYGIDLNHESITNARINKDINYHFNPDSGFIKTESNAENVFSGIDIIRFSEGDLSNASTRSVAKMIMRKSLDFHLGNKKLNIRSYLTNK